MRAAATFLYGLLSVAAGLADARSWQHVGKKSKKEVAPSKLQSNFLATRQVPEPKFASNSTRSE